MFDGSEPLVDTCESRICRRCGSWGLCLIYIYIYIDLGEALGVQIARRGLEHWRFDEVHGVVDSVAYW